MKPLCIDLFCGLFGWGEAFAAEGYRVIGFDITRRGAVPAGCEMVLQDVLTIDGRRMAGAAVIVASPPCPEFTRHMMPWTRARNPPPPDLSLWRAAERIADEAGVPLIIENVREAQNWIGRAAWHCGSFYLWGDVPALMPKVEHRPKESMSSSWKAERAKIPFPLAQHIARTFKP